MKPTILKMPPLLIHSITYFWRSFLLLALPAALAVALVACNPGEREPSISVVTTLYPLEYFAQRIGGDEVSVVNLLKPGIEAHDFEPTPGDIRVLEAADIIVYNGSGFEPWIDRALSNISGGGPRLITEASHGLAEEEHETKEDQQGHEHGGLDPHVWLDPVKAAQLVNTIRDSLSSANPDGAISYFENAENLLDELSTLDEQFLEGLSNCAQNHFVTSHAAFGHLASRYSLEQVAITGLSPEAEPGPGDLARMADTMRELGVKYIMVEPIIGAGFAETLAQEVDAELLTLHPLESLTEQESTEGEDYFSLMATNLENLRLALECS